MRERLRILNEIDTIIETTCVGCKKPPYSEKAVEKDRRSSWCRHNCEIATKISSLGRQLEQTTRDEKAVREAMFERMPEDHYLKKIRPDVGASDLELAAL